MSRAIRLFQNLLKFGMPLYLVLVPVMVFYDWFSPWAAAEDALLEYQGQTPLLVGASYHAQYSLAQGRRVTSSRSYIFLPAVLSDPKIIAFTQENGAAVTKSESRLNLLLTVLWLVLSCVGTWWFWLRRVPPNNSFKPKPLRGSA
jgi:hypothetical protein